MIIDVNELNGEWHVTCQGKAMPFNLIHDHKVILDGSGYNVKFGFIKWGYFYVTPFDGGFLLNYDHDKNNKSLRGIRDIVKKDGDGWSGKLYNKGELGFEFTLTRV